MTFAKGAAGEREACHRLPRGREDRRGGVEDSRSRRRDPEQVHSPKLIHRIKHTFCWILWEVTVLVPLSGRMTESQSRNKVSRPVAAAAAYHFPEHRYARLKRLTPRDHGSRPNLHRGFASPMSLPRVANRCRYREGLSFG